MRAQGQAAVVVDYQQAVIGVLALPQAIYSHNDDGPPKSLSAHDENWTSQRTRCATRTGTVGDHMYPCRLSATGDALVSEAASCMADNGLSWLPVITKEGGVLGLLCMMDIVRWVAEFSGSLPIMEVSRPKHDRPKHERSTASAPPARRIGRGYQVEPDPRVKQ